MKKNSSLVLLIVLLICSISLSVTYSKYLLTKNITGEVNVPEVDYCIRNGVTSLSECMLVMENYSSDANSAKLYISSKGEANFSITAPVTTYVMQVEEDVSSEDGLIFSSNNFNIASSYEFDVSTGLFTLKDNFTLDELKDDYIGWYTCGANNVKYKYCFTLYQIKEWDKKDKASKVVYSLNKADIYNSKSVDTFDSEIGLYATEDDYGTSYYYRGNVKK